MEDEYILEQINEWEDDMFDAYCTMDTDIEMNESLSVRIINRLIELSRFVDYYCPTV
ncbi:MAG: hypothetical protein LBR28_05600 [Bacteroidales bacterium]|jgi:hypothetical protein|nr:hypothetical protein [Bacteroidales bacterium]